MIRGKRQRLWKRRMAFYPDNRTPITEHRVVPREIRERTRKGNRRQPWSGTSMNSQEADSGNTVGVRSLPRLRTAVRGAWCHQRTNPKETEGSRKAAVLFSGGAKKRHRPPPPKRPAACGPNLYRGGGGEVGGGESRDVE